MPFGDNGRVIQRRATGVARCARPYRLKDEAMSYVQARTMPQEGMRCDHRRGLEDLETPTQARTMSQEGMQRDHRRDLEDLATLSQA